MKEYNKALEEEARALKLSVLGPEPEENEEGITTIVFRKPVGSGRITRRFHAH